MITEALWPASVKQYIRKYRAEGALNTAAIAYIQKRYITTFVLISIGSAFLFYVNEIIPALIVVLLSPIGAWLDVKMLFHRYMIVYVKGVKRDVKVLNAIVGGYGVQTIIYRELDDKGGEGRIEIPGTPFVEIEGSPIIKKAIFLKTGK